MGVTAMHLASWLKTYLSVQDLVGDLILIKTIIIEFEFEWHEVSQKTYSIALGSN